MTIKFHHSELQLLPQKAVYIPARKTLIIGDVHIGKTLDLQREGVRIPDSVARRNIERLIDLLRTYEVEQCIFLGDLFHAWANAEFALFADFMTHFPDLEFILVRGNHEKLKDEDYEQLGLRVLQDLELDGILLQHHPDIESEQPSMSAHVHPKVRMSAGGRQTLVCPAFVVQGHCLIIPAFGELTGGHKVNRKQCKAVYVVAEDEVIPL